MASAYLPVLDRDLGQEDPAVGAVLFLQLPFEIVGDGSRLGRLPRANQHARSRNQDAELARRRQRRVRGVDRLRLAAGGEQFLGERDLLERREAAVLDRCPRRGRSSTRRSRRRAVRRTAPGPRGPGWRATRRGRRSSSPCPRRPPRRPSCRPWPPTPSRGAGTWTRSPRARRSRAGPRWRWRRKVAGHHAYSARLLRCRMFLGLVDTACFALAIALVKSRR